MTAETLPTETIQVEQFTQYLMTEQRSPRTIRGYLSDLRTFAQWYAQTFGASVHTAQPLDLVEYRSWLQTAQKVSTATLNRHIASLRTYYAWAQDNGLTTVNASTRLKMKKEQESTAPKSLTQAEFYRLVGVIKTVTNDARRTRDMAAVYLMRYAGLRISEACALLQSDVDPVGKTLRISHGKGDKARTVPLNDKLADALQEWQAQRTGYKTASSEYILVSTRSDSLHPSALEKVVSKYLYDARLEDYSCHSLRHTCAKSLVDAGVGIERVAAILGHERIETTKRYVRPTQQDLQDAINRI